MGKFLDYLKLLAFGVVVYFIAKYEKKSERKLLIKEAEKRRDSEQSLAIMKEVKKIESEITEKMNASLAERKSRDDINLTKVNPDLKFGTAKDRLSK